MSLLLEALKKAERAKEEAQRKARAESDSALAEARPAPAATPEPAAAPEPAEAPAEQVVTRDKLPDIHQPLEILDDTPKPAPRAEPVLELAPESPAPARPAAPERPRAPAADTQAAERASARKVFEAKFREPNPRLPFYITLGVLGAFAVGTVIYFWIQLRPAPPLVNLNPPRPSDEAPVVAAAPVRPAAAAAAPSPAAASTAIPGLPTAPAVAPSRPAPAAPRAAQPRREAPRMELPRAEVEPPRARAPRAMPVREPAAAPAAAGPEISATRQAPRVHPGVAAGYSAYQAGDFAAARREYEEALREEPDNRDALLGLAALDVRDGRFEAAEAAYLRLLQGDPRDPHAQAGLLALRAGRVDPLAAESRVKSMLADNPSAHVLHFTLGNQLAQQGRWAEAQQEYFKAFTSEPGNPDFAYNLAVALDHLRQPKLALEYYRRAVDLAKTRGAAFDLAAAQTRIAQLAR